MIYTTIRNWKIVLILACFTVVLSGCSGTICNVSNTNLFAKFQNKKTPAYHEFSDVLIPGQLNINKKKTCVFRTSKFSVGVLSFKGRMDSSDVVYFFKRNMTDDNWHIVNSFKSSRSLLLFQKDSRMCAIGISEVGRFVHVEIWVLPDETVCVPEFVN